MSIVSGDFIFSGFILVLSLLLAAVSWDADDSDKGNWIGIGVIIVIGIGASLGIYFILQGG